MESSGQSCTPYGTIRQKASPLTFTIQWEPTGDRRSVTVPGTKTIGWLAGHIVDYRWFLEDEPPAPRRGVLFPGETVLDEKATSQSAHAVLKACYEEERRLSWILISEPTTAGIAS